MRVLKSEWLKLVSVRTTWALLAAMILTRAWPRGLSSALGTSTSCGTRNVATLIIGTHLAIVFMFTLGAPAVDERVPATGRRTRRSSSRPGASA